jgi:CubicO group peptidase (beta-lactamase class C family)
MKTFGTLFFSFLALGLFAQVDINALDQYFQKAQKDWNVPGMSIAVVKDGKVVLAKGYGVIEQGESTPVDENSIYAIASNTKAFVAAAIGILVDEGKMSWDDPVQKHLPYFELYDPWVAKNAKVRDLLCHRLGLGTFSGDVLWFKSNYSAEEVVKRARHLPGHYDIRAGYGYSNLMFIAAGEVVKTVSGKTWGQFLKERIFQPLGMGRSVTSTSALKLMKNVAKPHKTIYGPIEPIEYVAWDNMGAAGGILSSAADMAKWMNLQLNNGKHEGKTIFSTNAQNTWWTLHNSFMVSPGSKQRYPTRHVSGYGLGWSMADHAGRMVVSHGGGYDGMYSHLMMVPEEKMGIVVLTNSMTAISSNLCWYTIDRFLNQAMKDWSLEGLESDKKHQQSRKDIVEQRLKSRVSGTQPSLPLSAFAGKYGDALYGDFEVKLISNQLELIFPQAPGLNATLSHFHYNTFEIKWKEVNAWFDFGTIQFMTDNQNKVTGIQFDVPNEDIFFEEIQAKRK